MDAKSLPVVVTYAQSANSNLASSYQLVVQVGSKLFWVRATTGFHPSIVMVSNVRPLTDGYVVCCESDWPVSREVKRGSALRSEIEGTVTEVVRSLPPCG
jgi:hypothetical protein